MTTIVYDHANKLIAVDGRCTSSGMITSDESIKWHTDNDGVIWFLSGCTSDYSLLFDSFSGRDRAYDLPEIPDAVAFIVRNNSVFLRGVTDKGEAWTQELTHSRCIGSGSSFALAALDFGKSAKEAVEYAATRDCYTGGKVSVYDIALGSFIE
jgi:ATP-dependent protease HslVU (ClpYQ) peptidase subunit